MSIESSGLEDVVVATTRLSEVDGARGRLSFVGVPIEELANRLTFEQAAFLLWFGREPSTSELATVEDSLTGAREEAASWAFAHPDPEREAADRIRAGLLAMPRRDGKPFHEMLRISGWLHVLAATAGRSLEEAAPPSLTRSHAADYLRLAGLADGPAPRDALDAYLVTVMEHGMNASTFTARVVASTGADTVSAVVAALGALSGPLHGGAPGPVLDMLDAIGEPGRARPWLEAALGRGERIMGMGHRVYRARDPRAFVLEAALRRLEGRLPSGSRAASRLALCRAVEAEAESLLAALHPDRPLKANVEFYTAVLLEALGIDRRRFTATFAASRAVGWCAHVDEQRRFGRLIRPASRWTASPEEAPAIAGLSAG